MTEKEIQYWYYKLHILGCGIYAKGLNSERTQFDTGKDKEMYSVNFWHIAWEVQRFYTCNVFISSSFSKLTLNTIVMHQDMKKKCLMSCQIHHLSIILFWFHKFVFPFFEWFIFRSKLSEQNSKLVLLLTGPRLKC